MSDKIWIDKDIDRNKMILHAIQGKIIVRYTTFDEDGLNIFINLIIYTK